MPVSKEQIVETIDCIVSSEKVEQYLIGITYDSAQRRCSYFGVGFKHYVVLNMGLSSEEALEWEEFCFNRLTKDDEKNPVWYDKYHHEKRNLPYKRSLGGKEKEQYDLYIAWW